jgi:exonuclease III
MTLINSTIGKNGTANREDSLSDKSKTKYYNKPHSANNNKVDSVYGANRTNDTIGPRGTPSTPSITTYSTGSNITRASTLKSTRRFITPQYQNTQTYCSQGDVRKRRQYLNSTIETQTKRKEYKKKNYDRTTSTAQTNQWFGDKMVRHKGWETGEYSDTIRICTINVNGIAQDLDWIEWDTTLRSMYSQQIDILGVTEPNINFKNMHVKSKLYDIAKSFERNTQFSTSCSNQLRTVKKKQGGTMTILSGRWAGRKHSTKSDSLGRWSSMTLVGKKGRKVTVITAYRVCQQKGGDGCTVYHQQQLDFEQSGKRMTNLRKQFCLDMVQFVRSLHQQHQIVILMGDFNEDFNQSGNEINTMIKDCGLVNVYTKVHGDQAKQPNTYDRGTKCLDTIAITDSAQIPKHSIKRAGFMPFYHEFCSDHRAVYCDLDTKILFGKIRIDSINTSTRPFTTNNIKQCNKFKETVRKLYRKSKIFQNVKIL